MRYEVGIGINDLPVSASEFREVLVLVLHVGLAAEEVHGPHAALFTLEVFQVREALHKQMG